MALCGKAPKDRVEDEWRAAREWKPLVCLKKKKKSYVRLLRFYQEIILAFPSALQI